MSRPTDTERGARLALDIAELKVHQPDLFLDALSVDFWRDIANAAAVTVAECRLLKEAVHG